MDIVLDVFDTLVLDRLFATVIPASTASASFSSVRDGKFGAMADATFSSMRELPTDGGYQYHPASQYLQLQPSEWAYMSAWPRDNIYRQTISLYLITLIFGLLLYFVFSSLSYVFVFDKATFSHPRFLKNQVRQEIRQAVEAIPVMGVLTTVCFLAEVRGYAKLYDTVEQGPGRWYTYLQFPFFIMFTDFCIYWIHRGLHHPLVYKRLHKPHHKWIMPTPYASHAFHPLDGFAQSVPYHLFPFLFPLQKFAYLALFIFINFWTIFIHDGEYVANSHIINGAACHTMHHLYFRVNFGQFTTLWDRLGGSYRQPNDELFRRETKMDKKEWDKQVKEMETVIRDVEGEDDRSYGADPNDDRQSVMEGKKVR
ncbi:MAG: c-5 sterol desaturase [Peltula sp. TS41687]|nr:MAG: c-5 sterol desaturase [Peltula sp. TS41687]